MPETYRTTRVKPARSDHTLVVHCCSLSFQPYFQEFLRKGLGLDSYMLFALPGGAQSLTLAEYLPKFAWAGWRWMKFMVNLEQPGRAVLIAHEDCSWYREQQLWQSGHDERERLETDLRRVRAALLERFPATPVELYCGRLIGGQAAFEAVL